VDAGSGNVYTSYSNFYNYNDIKNNLPGYTDSVAPYGDLPYHFVAKLTTPTSGSEFTVGI
jgi:hypothetical protein